MVFISALKHFQDFKMSVTSTVPPLTCKPTIYFQLIFIAVAFYFSRTSMYDLFPNIETIHIAYGNLIPNLDHTQHAINGPPTWDLYPLWHSLRCLSDGVMFQDWSIWCFLVCCNFIFSPKFSLFPFYFCVLSVFSPPLCFTFLLAKMRISTFNIHCWSCLLFLLGGTAVW